MPNGHRRFAARGALGGEQVERPAVLYRPARFPIAGLRYTKATGLWAIYWRDRSLKFHQYERKRPAKNVQALLDHIEKSGDPIFWG